MNKPLHLIVDVGGISYNRLHSIGSKANCEARNLTKEVIMALESEQGFKQWKYDFTVEILRLMDVYRPNLLTLACDGGNLWRKDIFPEYKSNRAAAKEKLPIDWDAFGKARNEIVEELALYLPIRTMRMPRIEADDIAAVMVEKLHQEHSFLAISDDGDWYQNFKHPGYRQIRICDRREIKDLDHVAHLQLKVMIGDSGDAIPNLYPGKGPVKWQKVITECNGNLYKWSKENNLLEQYERNQRLINFDYIPADIKENIWNNYQSKQVVKVSHVELMDYFGANYDIVCGLDLKNMC